MCTLRVYGTEFDAEAYLASQCALEPCAVFWPGQPTYDRRVARGKGAERGFHVSVSDRGWDDWDGQIEDATSFLERHQEVLRDLARHDDVDTVVLDFPCDVDPEAKRFVLWDEVLPVALLRAAADAGACIEVTLYVAGSEARSDTAPN